MGVEGAEDAVQPTSTNHPKIPSRMVEMYHRPMRLAAVFGLGLVMLATTACGKEAGRLAFTAEGEKEATMNLSPGPVAFWTDIDLEYEGDSNLVYQIELMQKNVAVGVATCSPLGNLPVKTGWVSTDVGSKHSRSGSGKMACDTNVATGGPTVVHAKLAWSTKPASATLKKAELVLKQ